MTSYTLDTDVIVSHLRDDRFASDTDTFLRRARGEKIRLVIPEVVYAELYTGVYLSKDSRAEESRVQKFLSVNGVEVRSRRSLKIARRAGELYANHLMEHKVPGTRILPDFLVAAQAEASSDALVTWNLGDYAHLSMSIRVLTPAQA